MSDMVHDECDGYVLPVEGARPALLGAPRPDRTVRTTSRWPSVSGAGDDTEPTRERRRARIAYGTTTILGLCH